MTYNSQASRSCPHVGDSNLDVVLIELQTHSSDGSSNHFFPVISNRRSPAAAISISNLWAGALDRLTWIRRRRMDTQRIFNFVHGICPRPSRPWDCFKFMLSVGSIQVRLVSEICPSPSLPRDLSKSILSMGSFQSTTCDDRMNAQPRVFAFRQTTYPLRKLHDPSTLIVTFWLWRP